jgi:hypothetical protein
MDREKSLNRLEFDNQNLLDMKIDREAVWEVHALVLHRERDLASVSEAPQGQLVRQTSPVGRLQKPRTQMTMHFHGGTKRALAD